MKPHLIEKRFVLITFSHKIFAVRVSDRNSVALCNSNTIACGTKCPKYYVRFHSRYNGDTWASTSCHRICMTALCLSAACLYCHSFGHLIAIFFLSFVGVCMRRHCPTHCSFFIIDDGSLILKLKAHT